MESKNLTSQFGLMNKAEGIRKKLMELESWKVKSTSNKRKEYDFRLKNKKNFTTEPFQQEDKHKDLQENELLILRKNHHNRDREYPTKLSHVFNESRISESYKSSKRDIRNERRQLQELIHDKSYLSRVLLDEHVRMLFLRSSKLNTRVRKKQPINRLWLESMSSTLSQNSESFRRIIRTELRFLQSRNHVQRQLSFWHRLTTLCWGQLYNKKRMKAFTKDLRFEYASETLELLWRWFNKGWYKKVERRLKKMVAVLETWKEHKQTSLKFQLLADMYYLRGLSLMRLENYDAAYKSFHKDAELGHFMENKTVQHRTDDNIARILAIKGHHKEAARIWKERIATLEASIERAWAFYNIGQCYALDGAYDKAMEYANKSIKYAEESKSYSWELNANMLLANCAATLGAKAEVQLRTNTQISLKAISRAYQCSVFLGNVGVIRKISEIAQTIYSRFIDVDTSLLEQCWSSSLLTHVTKAAAAYEKNRKPENTAEFNTSNQLKYAASPLALPSLRSSLHSLCSSRNQENQSPHSTSKPDLPSLQITENNNSSNTTKKSKKNFRKTRKMKKKVQQETTLREIDSETCIRVVTEEDEIVVVKNQTTSVDNASNCSRVRSPVTAVEVLTESEKSYCHTSSSCVSSDDESIRNRIRYS